MANQAQAWWPAPPAATHPSPPLHHLLTDAERGILSTELQDFLSSELEFFRKDGNLQEFSSLFAKFISCVSQHPISHHAAAVAQAANMIREWKIQAHDHHSIAALALTAEAKKAVESSPEAWAASFRDTIDSSSDMEQLLRDLASLEADTAQEPKKQKKVVAPSPDLLSPIVTLLQATGAAMAFLDRSQTGFPIWPTLDQDIAVRGRCASLLGVFDILPTLSLKLFGEKPQFNQFWDKFAVSTGSLVHPPRGQPWTPKSWADSVLGYMNSPAEAKLLYSASHPVPSSASLLDMFTQAPNTQPQPRRQTGQQGYATTWRVKRDKLLLVGLACGDLPYHILCHRLPQKFSNDFTDEEALLDSSQMNSQLILIALFLKASVDFVAHQNRLDYPPGLLAALRGTFSIPSYKSSKHESFTNLLIWDTIGHDPAMVPYVLTAMDTRRLPSFEKDPFSYLVNHAKDLVLFDKITKRVTQAQATLAARAPVEVSDWAQESVEIDRAKRARRALDEPKACDHTSPQS